MRVLKFSAGYCNPCKMLKEVIEKSGTDVVVEDIDIEEQVDLAMTYKVRSIPTCVILDDDGKEIDRMVGMMNREQFLQFVSKVK
jgi:thioredoxin-like negative regulator of GroEL